MSEHSVPEELKYTKSHEWVLVIGDEATVGITDHAQALLGDLVFVELPDIEQELEAGEECAVVESVKAASDVYSPITGEITEINEALVSEPELVNKSPYGDGWLFKMKITDPDALEDLLTASAYIDSLEE